MLTVVPSIKGSKSRWTPYHGHEISGWPVATIIGGKIVMQNGDLAFSGKGKPFRFQEVDYHKL